MGTKIGEFGAGSPGDEQREAEERRERQTAITADLAKPEELPVMVAAGLKALEEGKVSPFDEAAVKAPE